MDELLIVDVAQSLTAGMQRAVFSKSDHMVSPLTHGLGSGVRGFDTAVTNKLGGKSAQQGLALIGRFIQLRNALSMSHALDCRHRREERDHWLHDLDRPCLKGRALERTAA